MKSRKSERRQLAAVLAGAVILFCAVAAGLFYKVTNVPRIGWHFVGPTALTGEMAGLFGGGLAAVVLLIVGLRWARDRSN